MRETQKHEYVYCEFLSIGIKVTLDFEGDANKQIQTTCLMKTEMAQQFLTGFLSFRSSMCPKTTRQTKKQVTGEMVFW